MLISCDDSQVINKIDDWAVELIKDNKLVEENNYPDWYGYRRIDSI